MRENELYFWWRNIQNKHLNVVSFSLTTLKNAVFFRRALIERILPQPYYKPQIHHLYFYNAEWRPHVCEVMKESFILIFEPLTIHFHKACSFEIQTLE